MSSPLILVPGSAPKPKEPPETRRAVGKPHGSYMAGLWEQRQTIWLCRSCAHKFDFKKHNYYREKYYVIGKCDACHDFNARNMLFIHDRYLTGVAGSPEHGQSWIPS
jgi:hypothetical protein